MVGANSARLMFLVDTSTVVLGPQFIRATAFDEFDATLNGDTVAVTLTASTPVTLEDELLVELVFEIRYRSTGCIAIEVPLIWIPWPYTNIDEREAILLDGSLLINPVGITIADRPVDFELFANYPNPFNPSTTIRFGLPESGAVSLTIYDVNGRLVRTLVSSDCAAGMHEMTWNARDDAGRVVASGVYVYRLTAGADVAVRRMVLVR
jgi:hypothetical protein